MKNDEIFTFASWFIDLLIHVSDKLKMHLQTLHKSRQAFIESESSVRIKRALKAKIRCADINLNPGDFVY